MFKFIINVYALILLFKITIAQIHLTKSNLDELCNCKSSQSISIDLIRKNIATIDSSTFKGLNSLSNINFRPSIIHFKYYIYSMIVLLK